ncbi:TPA: hypothetical protein OMI80_005388, partial [Klebsiella pneumoniae]|nr:hypothetical protein [Klebsiella pneumoniae]HCQ9162095.1 hypothetical protein [Klebsiella pneumoniae]
AVIRSNSITDVMSFTRATVATYFGDDGLLKYAAAGEPVIEYDQNTLACLGFRPEVQATNRVINSQNFLAANWSKTGIEVTDNDAVSPDGNKTASKIIEAAGAANTVHSLATTVTYAAVVGQPYTFSIFAKANSGSVMQIALPAGVVASAQFANFDLVNGKITRSSPLVMQANMEKCPNGWYRCSLTINPVAAGEPGFTVCLTGGNTAAEALPAYSATTVASIHIWGAQAERAAGYTSYIPTAGTEASRDADILTTPSGYTLIDSAKGAFFVSVVHPHSLKLLSTAYASLACAVVLDNAVEGAHYRLAWRGRDNMNGQAAFAELNAAGGTTVSVNLPPLMAVSDSEQAAFCMFSTGDLSMKAFDGQVWNSASPTIMPAALSRICLGRSYIGASNWFNGHIKKFVYWADNISQAEAEKYFSVL